jgi:hypothetical protein
MYATGHRGQLLAVGENNEIGVNAVAKSVLGVYCTWKNGQTHFPKMSPIKFKRVYYAAYTLSVNSLSLYFYCV